jgi:hypothetical protein
MLNWTLTGKPGVTTVSALATPPEEKLKRGPRTIPDNFLLGNRNALAELLEQSWLKIGRSLLRIRDKRTSTIEDVRKAMEPVRGMPHNSGWAAPFYRETLESAKPSTVLKIQKQVGDLDAEIIKDRAKREEGFRSCLNADAAMRMAGPNDKDIIQEEALKRLQIMLQLADDFKKLEMKREALRQKWLAQEAYIFQSELLDFLHSRGRYAVNPRNIADALAGLPGMKWRQSFARCADMPFNTPLQEYQVLEVISEISTRLPEEIKELPLDSFRAALLKRSRRPDYTRQFLRDRWRDLRLAIEECWNLRADDAEAFPFLLSSTFMRNATRQKDAKEQLLSDREKLAP